ncbi:MAG: cob(I)yrinic acid a,c-diamide adenosyltransferase [Patescibacteria group bacterium]
MLYTGNGDKGKTSHLGSAKRVSKTDLVIEALGSLDELGSWIGLCKTKVRGSGKEMLEELQHDIFTIQAEVAGSSKRIGPDRTLFLEEKTDELEKKLPPLRTFLLAGANVPSALFDCARTVARRAERSLVALHEETPISDQILSYMNRLSSLLYALARHQAKKSGIKERPPKYR